MAGTADEPDIVDLVAGQLSAADLWALAPAEDEGASAARRSLARWKVRQARELGVLLVDDIGRPLGGHRRPYPAGALESRYRAGTPLVPSRQLGPWLYPADLPTECNARLNRLARAVETLSPPRPVQCLTVGAAPGLSRRDDLWTAWLERAVPLPTSVIAAVGGPTAVLEELGFVVVAEVRASRDGCPALANWLHTPG